MRDVHDGRTLEPLSIERFFALKMNPIYPRPFNTNLSGIKRQTECLVIHKEFTKEKVTDNMIGSVCTWVWVCLLLQ